MLKISTMPKETLVELLLFLADNEKFDSVKRSLGEGVTVPEVRAVLRELSCELAKEIPSESKANMDEMMKQVGVSPKARKIISALSEKEQKNFLSAFGLTNG